MIKNIITTSIFFFSFSFFTLSSMAMDKSVFEEMIDKLDTKDFETVGHFLTKEEKKLINDPEYHVILLNYSFRKRNNTLFIGKGKPKEGDLALQKQDKDEVVGFIRQGGNEIVINAINKTRQYLPKFNNRLDIHLGIVAISAAIEKWEIVGNQLFDILSVSKKIKNKWIWGPVGKMEGEPKTFMLNNIQSRIEQLFRVQTKATDKILIKTSKAMIKHYPEVIYGYSNLGVMYSIEGKYGLSEKYLNQALFIDPEDQVVKKNLEFLKQKKQKRQQKKNKTTEKKND